MIHASAIIEPGAELGANVSVGPFSYIEAQTRIGDGCVIGPRVSILRYTTLGAGCEVHSGAVLGDLPQDLSFRGAESYVRIGDRCVIREGVTIHRGTKDGTTTEIGEACFLMGYSHFAHNVKLGARVIVVNGALLAGYVEVGDGAFISGNVVIHQFTRIGRLAILGGACGLNKDVPPFCMTRPLSLNRVVGLNVIGLRRAGVDAAGRLAIKRAFNLLYRSGLNVSDAVARLRGEWTGGPAIELADFIENSRRGICALSTRGATGASPEADDE